MLILSNDDIEKILPVASALTCSKTPIEPSATAWRRRCRATMSSARRSHQMNSRIQNHERGAAPARHRRASAQLQRGQVVREGGRQRTDKLPVAGGDRYVGLIMLFSTETGVPLAIFPMAMCRSCVSPAPARSLRAIWRARCHHDGFTRFRLAGKRASGHDGDGSRSETGPSVQSNAGVAG